MWKSIIINVDLTIFLLWFNNFLYKYDAYHVVHINIKPFFILMHRTIHTWWTGEPWPHYWTCTAFSPLNPLYQTLWFSFLHKYTFITFYNLKIYSFLNFLPLQGPLKDPERQGSLLLFADVSSCLGQCLAHNRLSMIIEWKAF